MNKRSAVSLYVGSWVVTLALVIAVLVYAGASIWSSIALAYLLFVVVNGSLAYRHHARKLASEGAKAPSYLTYLFFGRSGSGREVQVPRPIRVFLGIVIVGGGVIFLVVPVVLLVQTSAHGATSFVGTAALLLLVVSLGCAFLYTGARLVLMKDGERLFKRSLATEPGGA